MIKDFLIATGNYKKFPELIKRKVGDTIIYVTLLLLICSIGIVIFPMATNSKKIVNGLKSELPNFTITEAGFEIDETFDINLGGVRILATNEKSVTEADFEDCVSGVLLDHDKFIIKNIGKTMSFKYSEFKDEEGFCITKASLSEYKGFYIFIIIVLYIAFLLLLAITYILDGFVIAAFTSIILTLMGFRLPIGKHIKLALYAQTLPLIIRAIMSLFGTNLNSLISITLASVVIIMSAHEEKNKMTPSEEN